jgi:alpha-1,6-mannosyltransferase
MGLASWEVTRDAAVGRARRAISRFEDRVGESRLVSALEPAVDAARRARERLFPPLPGSDEVAPAPTRFKEAWALLRRPALLGVIATTAITLGAAQPSSPFTLKQAGAWFYGIPQPTARPGQGMLLGVVAVYGGMLLLFRVWFSLARLLTRRPGLPVAGLAVLFALWVVPLLVAPPLFSKDVYSYAAQGDMVSHHISPYEYGPNVLGAGQYVSNVDPLWGNAAAPYGPLFLALAGLTTTLTAHHDLLTVVGLRLLALLGVVIAAVFLPRLARSYGRDPAVVFTVAILNPITLLHLIGGAHNDALMAGLLIAGLALARTGHPVLGIVACALGAAVKVPAVIGVAYIGWEWLGPGVPWRLRVRPVVTAGIISAAVLAVLSAATGLGWGWLGALGTPGTVKNILSPATGSGMLLGNLAHAVGIPISTDALVSMTRGLGLAAAFAIGAAMLLSSDRIGAAKAIAVTLLAFGALGPVVQPWYLSWGLMMLAVVATTGRLRAGLMWVSILASFIGLPGGWLLLDQLAKASLTSFLVGGLILLAIPTTPLVAWRQRLLERFRSQPQLRS